MDWVFPMIGLLGQLAARRLRVAFPGRLPMDWVFNSHLIGVNVKAEVKVDTNC